MDYWKLILQESHTLNMANPCHNMKIMSPASFSLASVWFANPIKIQREEPSVGSGVNIGYVSDDQMAWNVVNGANRSFWNSVFIWFYNWFSVTAGVSLIFIKSTAFRRRSVKKDLNDVKLYKTFDLLRWVFFVKHFWLILAKCFLMMSAKFSKSHENWWNILVLINILYNTTVVNWI